MARAALQFLAMAFASASAPALAAPQWTVSEVAGQVTITQGGTAAAAHRGTVLQPGASVTTGHGGRAVLVRGEEFVTVAADAKLRLPPAEQAGGVVQWLQDWGASLFRVEKKTNPHFGVETPYLAAVVKGTTFRVTVSGKGAMLQVVEGAVEVATLDGAAHELLRPGMVASIGAADRLRLNVDGASGHQTIDSPARVAPVARDNASAEPLLASAIDDDGGSAAAATGGLVQGDLGGKLVAMFVADQRAAALQVKAEGASDSAVVVDSSEPAAVAPTGTASTGGNTTPSPAADTGTASTGSDTSPSPAADAGTVMPPVSPVVGSTSASDTSSAPAETVALPGKDTGKIDDKDKDSKDTGIKDKNNDKDKAKDDNKEKDKGELLTDKLLEDVKSKIDKIKKAGK